MGARSYLLPIAFLTWPTPARYVGNRLFQSPPKLSPYARVSECPPQQPLSATRFLTPPTSQYVLSTFYLGHFWPQSVRVLGRHRRVLPPCVPVHNESFNSSSQRTAHTLFPKGPSGLKFIISHPPVHPHVPRVLCHILRSSRVATRRYSTLSWPTILRLAWSYRVASLTGSTTLGIGK